MAQTLDDCRYDLINTILFAHSQDEVKSSIDNILLDLKTHQINKHLVVRFIDKAIGHLQLFSPLDHDSQQWANIKTARFHLNQARTSMQPPLAR